MKQTSPNLPDLSVTLVTYDPDLDVLERTIDSLALAAEYAVMEGSLGQCHLTLVDNGPGGGWREPLHSLLDSNSMAFATSVLLSGHGNIGYGRGHNRGAGRLETDFNLVLNPDVVMDRSSLDAGIRFLAANPHCSMAVPAVFDSTGTNRQFPAKRYPSVLVLGLRGFAPKWLQRLFAGKLNHYEMRDLVNDGPIFSVEIASGCFMLIAGPCFRKAGGFSDRFFMYFEDYDLSVRLREIGPIAWCPDMKVIHMGGGASRKGMRHIRFFTVSALKFFSIHGWRWF